MPTEPNFQFLIDRDRNIMTIRRWFAAGRQLVWDCHTQSAYLDQWFAPKPLTTRTKSMDFRPGGHWHYAMIMPDGQEFWARMDYLTIDPIDGYLLLDGFSDESGALNPDLPRAEWNVSFVEDAGRTLVQTLASFASSADIETVIGMGIQEGITSSGDRLEELLAVLTKA